MVSIGYSDTGPECADEPKVYGAATDVGGGRDEGVHTERTEYSRAIQP